MSEPTAPAGARSAAPADSAPASSAPAKGAPSVLAEETAGRWTNAALMVVIGSVLLRWALLALQTPPLHFDEAQYWTYGESLAFGYYSKPPMIAWLIRLSTEALGDSAFGVRAFAPVIHAAVAWLLFATGRRLFDGRTGFWAAAAYLLMPGVVFSSGLMTTDPPMMAAWALALYALVRAIDPSAGAGAAATADPAASGGGRFGWWALLGAAIGLGLLSKYTIVAFVGGALGYALFSRQGRWGWRPTRPAGPLLAIITALIVWSPNLYWNYQNDFASIVHVGDNTKLGGGVALDPTNAAAFFGAQIGIMGPLLFAALMMLVFSGVWRDEWRYRLLLWLCLPLIVVMTAMGFLTRAHPNWAAPAYIAGALAASAYLLDRNARSWLLGSAAIGLLATLGGYAALILYDLRGPELPRLYDLAKRTRPYQPVCERALSLRPDAVFLSPDRRLLAVCLHEAGRSFEEGGRMWSETAFGNHYALTGALTAPNAEELTFIMLSDPKTAEIFTGAFERADLLESGVFDTHADRTASYVIVSVQGFGGYADPPPN